jgi:glycosyltransferase involved in cell wall biosynthesis
MTEELPLVTACMLIKNRIWSLKAVLNALEDIHYPKRKLKLVFVDDFSDDGSYEFLTEWSRARSMNFYNIEIIRARTNIPQARNLCIDHTEGEYLLFWDSDVIPPPELLLEMVNLMKKDKHVGIIGSDYIYDPSLKVKYAPMMSKETYAVYMGFTLIQKDVFKIAGKFNELLTVGEDTEFCIRVKERSKYTIYWAPKPVLHLKRLIDVTKPGILRDWLRYNLTVRAKEYYSSWKSLPRFLKLRIVYWILWPWTLMLLAYTLMLGNIIIILFLLLYILASAYLVIRQRGVTRGIELWIKSNVLTGLALSYGILIEVVKNFAKRKHITSARSY